jgi:uncharacterized protein
VKTFVLVIPGFGNSGPSHWQTLWEAKDSSMVRIRVDDWDHPRCDSWIHAIDAQIASMGQSAVVVAHSLGCLAFVHWAAQRRRRIRGALLVAVPDPSGSNFPAQAEGFSPVPLFKLPCRSILVFSQDDPYTTAEYAKSCADVWGSTLVDIGRAGHINSASNLGGWSVGHRLLSELRLS